MKSIKTIDELVEIIEWFNIEKDIFFCNSEVYVISDELRIVSVIEGYNHTTLQIDFNKHDIEEMQKGCVYSVIENKYTLMIDDFDIDEEFNMLWSCSFAEYNSFTPSQFLRILVEDKAQFENIDYKILA